MSGSSRPALADRPVADAGRWPGGRAFLSALATAFWLGTVMAIGGCAAVPRADESPLMGEVLAGRMAVKVDGLAGAAPRSVTAAFVLQGDAQNGKLNLATPLGSVLAQARWAPGQVVLATPQGEKRFADLDALTEEVLGESLPIAALFDWLRGRPWRGAVSRPTGDGFEQLGWLVDLARFDDAAVDARRIALPAMTVRARLDRAP